MAAHAVETVPRNVSPNRQIRPERGPRNPTQPRIVASNPASRPAIIIRVSGVRVPPPASKKPRKWDVLHVRVPRPAQLSRRMARGALAFASEAAYIQRI